MYFNRQVIFRVLLKSTLIEIKELRVKFEIKKTRTQEQNVSKIELYNLSETTRANIKTEGESVELYAGYGDDIALIFRGNIREVFHKKESENIITTITAGDGDRAFSSSFVNTTLEANTSLQATIETLVSKLQGIKKGKIVGIEGLEGNKTATTLTGTVRDELDRLASKYDFSYTIENEVFNLVRNRQHTGLSEVISVDSGMLDAPIATEKGVDVKTLLNNNLRCNDLFRLESKFLKRDYRIDELLFSGDTHSTEWFSILKGVSLGTSA